MGSVPSIAPGSITNMTTTADDRLVFFLQLQGSKTPTVVIKGEVNPLKSASDAEASIKWGSKIMKHVNNELVNTKILAPAEASEVRRAVSAYLPGRPKKLQAVCDPQILLTKLPYVTGLSNAEFRDEAGPGEAGNDATLTIKRLIYKFQHADIWHELGKVVAVDIFNGNQDRFTLNGDWQNMGNVMFLDGGKTQVIGLDIFDPNSPYKNLNAAGQQYPELAILKDRIQRKSYATKCVTSVGTQMQYFLKQKSLGYAQGHITLNLSTPTGPSLTKIRFTDLPTFFLPFTDDFDAGLADGAQETKAYLRRKVMEHRPDLLASAMASHRSATASVATARRVLPPPPPPSVGRPLPLTTAPLTQSPLPPAPVIPAPPVQKTIPQGVIDRMKFLGWL